MVGNGLGMGGSCVKGFLEGDLMKVQADSKDS